MPEAFSRKYFSPNRKAYIGYLSQHAFVSPEEVLAMKSSYYRRQAASCEGEAFKRVKVEKLEVGKVRSWKRSKLEKIDVTKVRSWKCSKNKMALIGLNV